MQAPIRIAVGGNNERDMKNEKEKSAHQREPEAMTLGGYFPGNPRGNFRAKRPGVLSWGFFLRERQTDTTQGTPRNTTRNARKYS